MIRGQNLFLDPKAILTEQWLISLSSRGCKVGPVEPNKDGGRCGANYLCGRKYFCGRKQTKNRNNRAKKNGWTFLQIWSSFSSSSETSEDDSSCNETDTGLQASSIEDGSSSAEDSGGDSVDDSEEYGVEEQPENKSTRKRNTAPRKKSGLAKDTDASRRKTDKDSEGNFRLIIGFGSLHITYVRYKIAEYV